MVKSRHTNTRPIHTLATGIARDLLNGVYDECDTVPKAMIETLLNKRFGANRLTKQEAISLIDTDGSTKGNPSLIKSNCRTFCRLFELDEAFGYVLQFILVMNAHDGFCDFFIQADFMDNRWDIDKTISDLAAIQISELRDALSKLHRLHLIDVDSLNRITGEELPPIIQEVLLHQKLTSKDDLLDHLLDKSTDAEFDLSAFDYVETDIVSDYLANVRELHLSGVNILLHGPSGSGKTQLAKALAEHAGLSLFDVRSRTIEGAGFHAELDSHQASKMRLQHLAMVCELLNPDDNAALLIDECESLFSQTDNRYSKETLQRLLEFNRIPVIWITNHVYELEPSFIRRFKLVIDVQPPEGDALLEVSKQHLKGLRLSQTFKQELIQTENITPAHIANAGHVAKVIHHTGKQAENTITHIVENSLEAADLLERPMGYNGELDFDIDLLNIKQSNIELKSITDAIRDNASVRVLLTGPAGTGKTAFAHHLAKQHQRNLKRVTGSDVLSKYVGESEQQVASLFREAHRVGDMLLLDEVDSLLSSRDTAQANHEVQLVNELLAQMECFTLPLFAATNYEQRLDKAVLRRFDFKLECDYLRPEQTANLYRQVLELKVLSGMEKDVLRTLKKLTPGDFAILQRRKRFTPLSTLRKHALNILKAENTRKQTTQPIGFIAN